MKVIVPITHALHRRNLIASGLVAHLEKRGHAVTVWSPPRPRWARLRRTLRLMTLVQGEPRSRTYRHKASLRTGGAKFEAAVWRRLRNRGVDLEALAIRIEGGLPVPDAAVRVFAREFYDLVLWPTMIHMDAVENDLIKAAKIFDVPVLAAPASWDSLTSKGAFLVRPDRLIVWGEASRRHAVEIHSFAPEHVAPAGPPHFWPYEGGVEPLGEKILVAGTSLHYWAEEQAFVAALEREFPGLVLHRPHPRTRRAGWNQLIDGPAQDLRQAAVVVAAFSTMIVEAALLGRPAILVGFGTGEQGRAVEHLAYDHMREIAQWPFVGVCRDRGELLRAVAAHLSVLGMSYDRDAMRHRALDIAHCHPGILDRFADAVERAQ